MISPFRENSLYSWTAVFVTAPDGQAARVASDSTSSPSWSPDGRRLAYAGREWVFIAAPDGGGRRRLTRGESPVWSPDGSRIAFTRGHAILTIRPDGRKLRLLGAFPECGGYSSCRYSIADWRPLRFSAAASAGPR